MSVDSPFGYGYDLSLNWKQTEALRDWVTALGALPEHQGPSKQRDSELSRCHLSPRRGGRHLGLSAPQVGLLAVLTPSLL